MEISQIIEFLEKNNCKNIVAYQNPNNWVEVGLIATATSSRHIHSLIVKSKEINLIKSRLVEGSTDSGWIAFNVKGVLIHIFTEERRNFYNLDDFWKESKE